MSATNLFLLDASALGKRYAPEVGSAVMHHLFRRAARDRLVVLSVGVLETASVLVRRRNAGLLTATQFPVAFSLLEAEIVFDAAITKVETDARLVQEAIPLISQHSINGTDALVLRVAMDFTISQRAAQADLILVTSDHRLLRAAQAEGLTTFNPETQSTADLDAYI